MTVLAALREDSDIICSLFPSLDPDLMDLMNVLNTSNPDLIEKVSSKSVFQSGVFDGAAIGMWLTGHDPRNNYGRALVHDSSPLVSGDSLLDPRAVDYEMDEEGNLYLISRNTGNRISLWNLHVHSKSLELFSEGWEAELRHYVVLAQNTAELPFFKASALGEMFIQSLKGRTFLRFIIGLPLVHKSRKWLSPIKQYILARMTKNEDVRDK
jgi:hypothetical protein